MKRFLKYAITLLVVMMLVQMITNAQTIKRSKQNPKTEKTQKQRSSNNKSNKQNTNPQKNNSSIRTDKVKQRANTTIEISISSNASDASVYIDDIYYGSIGGLYEVSPGSHKIMIIANGYETHESTIYVSSSHTSFNCHLNEITYVVTFKCNVSYASLSIDETVVGFANGQYSLSPGSHSIRIKFSGYEDITEYVSIYSDCSYSFDLIPIDYSKTGAQEYNISKVINNIDSEMIHVKGSTFTMGATFEQYGESETDEYPAHQVTLSDYYLSKYEVTQEMWLAVMGYNPSHFKGDLKRPVEMVSWEDCQTFLTKLNQMTGKNYRLPTEAEWEYAARGGDSSKCYKYSGSDNIADVAWFFRNSQITTHPVGTQSPNELGLYDMSGNVWEWCQDGLYKYNSVSEINPIHQPNGTLQMRVIRGGGYNNESNFCRVPYRNYDTPDKKRDNFGFRIAATSL